MITLTVLFLATLFLAYSNGANDNFKGVATVFGSGTSGLNDTPKIVALLFVMKTIDIKFGMLLVAMAMAIGGLLNAKSCDQMGKKITPLNPGQGFIANLVTSVLVILASRFGLPVSTTHVSKPSSSFRNSVVVAVDAADCCNFECRDLFDR